MERRVILSASLAHATTHSLELTFAALLLRIGLEFGADLAILGLVANVGTLTFGVTALPSGYLSDRFGPRAVMSGCMAAAAVFAGLVAASPTLPVLAVSLALLGAAIGLYHPAGTAMVSTVRQRRGLAFAAHGIAGNVGVSLAPALGTGIALFFGWRAAYLVLVLLALVVAALVWRIAPTREESAAARASATEAAPGNGGGLPRSSPPEQRRWLARPLLLIFFNAVGMGFIYRGSLTFLGTHLEQNLGFSIFGWSPEAVAAAMATLALLTAIPGQLFGGGLSDRWPVERAALPIVLLNPLMLALMAPASGVILILCSAGFVLTNFAQQPILNGLIADYAPEGAAGRAFGISFFMTFGLGSFAGSVAGLVADRSGTEPMFYMLAAVGVALAVSMLAVAAGAEQRRRAMIARGATVAAGS
ncbi:MAG: MFS transporter [Dehalococcoidia bacterium]|jgi:MFS family permease|nr:MFS transporter [Dehalococcoidia bacterium]